MKPVPLWVSWVCFGVAGSTGCVEKMASKSCLNYSNAVSPVLWLDPEYVLINRLAFAEQLQSAVLKAGAIGVLGEMIGSEYYETTYAGLHYLRVIAGFGQPSFAFVSQSATYPLCRQGRERASKQRDSKLGSSRGERIACATSESPTDRDGNLAISLCRR